MYTQNDPPLFCINSILFILCVLAIEVAEDLRKYILEIYGDFLSPDGFVSSLLIIASYEIMITGWGT